MKVLKTNPEIEKDIRSCVNLGQKFEDFKKKEEDQMWNPGGSADQLTSLSFKKSLTVNYLLTKVPKEIHSS